MHCDCHSISPFWMRFIMMGGTLSGILMIAGISIFNPILVPFPLPWVLGIWVLAVTITVPFYIMSHSNCKKENSKKED